MRLEKINFIACILLILLNSACAPKHTPSTLRKANNSTSNTIAGEVITEEYLLQVNQIRKKARKCGDMIFSAAPALKIDDKLNSVAMLHSRDMSQHNSLSHISSNGYNLVKRLSNVDYAWRAIAENIAHNQRSVNEVLTDWLSSPGHCKNLMSPDYQFTGFAQVNWYWTQVFATPK